LFSSRAQRFFFSKPGADQFSEGFPFDTARGEMVSSGGVGAVEQPASKIAAKTVIPVGLNTRLLCGTRKRTQVVLRATCLRRKVRA
jgi:hypothetical protein